MNPARLLEHFDCIAEAPDAIPRLRRFILDLAVRGKLVEQDPNDEPASALLKRIRAEKMRLVKAGKVKLPKPSSIHGLGNILYKIPGTWAYVPFGETIDAHYGGGTPSKNNSLYWDGDIYWASVKDVGKSKYIDKTIDKITKEGLENSSSNLIPSGSLIVVTRMGLGKVSINRVPVSINQDLRALFPSTLVNIDYQYIFFKTHGFEGTGLTVKGIKVDELLSVSFPLPPLAEQHRIVAKVDELMALCDRLEATQAKRESRRDRLVSASLKRVSQPEDVGNGEEFRENVRFHLDHLPRLTTRLEHVKELRQTILNLAVRGKLVPQDSSDKPLFDCCCKTGMQEVKPFNIPGNWGWAKLQTLGRLIGGGTPSKSKEEFWHGDIPWIAPKNMKRDYIGKSSLNITLDAVNNSAVQIIRRGSILFVVRGMILAHSFPVAISERRLTINQDMKALELKHADTKEYILRALKALKPFFLSKVQRSSHGTCRLVAEDYCSILIPLPPLDEQHRIVAKVDEFMALCDQLEAQITTAQADRSRLLEATLCEALGISNMPIPRAGRTISSRVTPVPRQTEKPLQAAKPRLVEPAHAAPQRSIADQPKPTSDSRPQSPPEAILAQMKPGQDYSRAQLCDALGLSVYEWNMAIRALKEHGQVIQTGERQGARYRLNMAKPSLPGA